MSENGLTSATDIQQNQGSILESAISPGIYRHFKGNRYQVLGTARHSETEEIYVIYRALYGEGGTWLRPLQMFTEIIERDGKKIPRFSQL